MLCGTGAAAAYFWRYAWCDGDHGWDATLIKSLSVGLLAGAAWAGHMPLAITLGLALGSLGDIALCRPGRAAFLGGVAAFALSHLAYVWGFAGHLATDGWPGWSVATGLIWGAVLALVISTEFWLIPKTGDLKMPVRAYAVIIGLTGISVTLIADFPGSNLLQLGVALFIFSDSLLALQMFVLSKARQRPGLGRLAWLCYWSAQALILFGAVGAGGTWVLQSTG